VRSLLAVVLLWASAVHAGFLSPVSMVITAGQWLARGQDRYYAIRVEATANTAAEAKAEAFRLAVEQAVGTLVLSEKEVKNGSLVRQDIVTYASGFVHHFHVYKEEPLPNGGVKVLMDVSVAESKIADRLLNKSTASAPADSEQMSARISTVIDERQRGDRVVAQVLADFPQRAFDVKVGSPEYRIVVNQFNQRMVEATVSFELAWNYDYVAGLFAAMKATEQVQSTCWNQTKCTPQYVFAVTANKSGGWSGREQWEATFSDPIKIQMLYKQTIGPNPVLQLVFRDRENNVAHTSCHAYQELNHRPANTVTNFRLIHFGPFGSGAGIDQTKPLKGTMKINLGQDTDLVTRLAQVEVRPVPAAQCNRV
jgi:hypothetical protein